ncbi:bifunctional ADP-dependent NAD(P)H-hydrate dehydratase/NAD(P)H-hydrate epimerase [Anaerolinea thermophila]|nr:bifunctional ADP-dependent NAD(P)H-hydrate dehydratase/NAD(P)H-hydrate epimerase [Anaerolinea thermophila]
MSKLVTVSEMRQIEAEANASGWTYDQMMVRAGTGVAQLVHSLYGYEEDLQAVALIGSGNNGGDALVALEWLASVGWKIRAYLVRPRAESDPLIARVLERGGEMATAWEDVQFSRLDAWLKHATVLIDGVLGTGIRLPLQEEVARVLAHVKDFEHRPPCIAVDCPSGVDCDSGEAAPECIPAEVTACMAGVKIGLLKTPAFSLVGEIQVIDIGLPAGLSSWEQVQREVIDEEWVSNHLPDRPVEGHKGTFGTATICGGCLNYSGAPLLAAEGAARSGVGLVQVAVPVTVHTMIAGSNWNVTWLPLPEEQGFIATEAAAVLLKSLQRATALLIGPGLGLETSTQKFLQRLLEAREKDLEERPVGFLFNHETSSRKPTTTALPALVIDADGLKLLAQIENWQKLLPPHSVLTPHPGEMAILTGLSTSQIQANRIETVLKFAREWNQVIVLKGAFTVIAAPDGRLGYIPIATNALAHGGTGDVLAGMITALRAQGMDSFEAACAGAWVHAQAGLIAAQEVGHPASVQATDVCKAIPDVLAWVWKEK